VPVSLCRSQVSLHQHMEGGANDMIYQLTKASNSA